MKKIIALLLLSALGLYAQVVIAPVAKPAPVRPIEWRATLDATQTIAAMSALGQVVHLEGLSLTNLARATLVVNIVGGGTGLVAYVSASVLTNAPAQ